MALAAEQIQFVQRQLNYRFRDTSRLFICFKAAHRSDIDGIADDGNRTLAKAGVAIIDFVEKRCLPVVGTESRDITHERLNWTKSKDLRAAACDNLGFTPLIITSVRQGNEVPSNTVRAATIGAIVAAVFEDLCDQKEAMASALKIVTDLIDLLVTKSLELPPNNSPELAQQQIIAASFSASCTMGATTRPVLGIDELIDLDTVEHSDQGSRPDGGSTVPGETTSCPQSGLSESCELHSSQQRWNLRPLAPRSNQQFATSPIQSTREHQTIRHIPGPALQLTGHVFSLDEEISRSIDEPYAQQLRFLFNYLGSIQSVVAFKRALSDLRGRKCADDLVLKGARSDAEHLRIVKKLRENAAADSLLTMCHTVRLFQGDTDDLLLHPGSFVVQTQTSFGRLRRTATGNPLSLSKAAITDRKIALLYPSLVPGSEEYKAERRYITRLRQSAAKLELFSKMFGFGIVAFLPYADPIGNGYHLNKLMDVPENRIACCIKIVQKFNSSHLTRLSASAGPIIEKMINGEFWSSNPSRFEALEEREVLASDSLPYDQLF